ncbi:MAG: TonB-dependent receptor [Candidatus Marinimicrobia bacterium]|nr:TonB-dependent receptor [Candidatus Neomarinimicrobiota bacterium]
MKKALFFVLLISSLASQESLGGSTISGYVLDSESGEGLPGANVILSGTLMGTATNFDGYFVITEVPSGSYELKISFMGFEPLSQIVNLRSGERFRQNFELIPQTVELQEVVVTEERMERKVNIQASRVKLNLRQMKGVPQIGEADLFRALHALPGVLTETEFSTGLIIRGGNSDQNLILLDGITVYNPSHLGGFFSNFILDAVKEADLLKGGFNAEYGGRLSAVLNVRSREGNRKKFEGKASVSLISAQTTLEGPAGEKGAWLVSGRRTYFDKVFQGTELYFPYYFYDVQGHIFQDITKNDRISLSWYTGRDDLFWEDFLLKGRWENKTVSLNYRKLFSETLVSHWVLAKSRFDILFGLGGGSGINEVDYIDDFTFRSDWTWFASQEAQFRFGTEVKGLDFQYSASYLDSAIFMSQQSPVEAAAYAKMKWWPSAVFMLEPGLRVGYYDNHPEKWYFDPRLGIKYLLTEDRYLNFSLGIYHQFMETIQDDFYPKIMDAWFAVDYSVTPASAVQVTAGYEEYFGAAWRVQVEAYYKTMNNMLTFVESRSTVDEIISDESLADLVDEGDGYAYGAELFLHKEIGRLNGWVAYAHSISRKQFGGKEYYTNWDRRHVFNILGNYRISRKWDANLKWTYQTGQPYTPILGYFIEVLPGDPEPFYRPIPGGRNSSRYEPFHRMDVGIVRHFKLFGTPGEFFIQVVNAYWQKNIFRYIYQWGNTYNGIDDDGDELIDEDDEGTPKRLRINGLPILPTIGVSFAF